MKFTGKMVFLGVKTRIGVKDITKTYRTALMQDFETDEVYPFYVSDKSISLYEKMEKYHEYNCKFETRCYNNEISFEIISVDFPIVEVQLPPEETISDKIAALKNKKTIESKGEK